MICNVSCWALELKRTFCLGWILCRKEDALDGGIVEDGKVRSHLSHSLMGTGVVGFFPFLVKFYMQSRFKFVGSGWLIGEGAWSVR